MPQALEAKDRLHVDGTDVLFSAEEGDQISGRYQGSVVTLLPRDPLARSFGGTVEVPRVAQRSPQGLRTGVDLGGEYSTKVPQQAWI
jgi:hypothetical protein